MKIKEEEKINIFLKITKNKKQMANQTIGRNEDIERKMENDKAT